jgi:hypothetical protein
LSVQSFLKGVHIVEYSEAALSEVAHHVVALANAEDLPAHGEAVTIRFPHEQQPPQAQHGDLGSQYPEFTAAEGGPAAGSGLAQRPMAAAQSNPAPEPDPASDFNSAPQAGTEQELRW